jgi:hypothetical protein
MSKKSKKTSRKKRKKNLSTSSSLGKYPAVKITAVLVILIGGYVFYDKHTRVYPVDIKRISVTNVEFLRGGETRPTLSPVPFIGETAKAYQLAKDKRDLLDSMFCYCNCKKNYGHKSLLSCYVDNHAEKCKICQDQTFYAYSQYQQGKDIAQVRITVDKKFWKPLK